MQTEDRGRHGYPDKMRKFDKESPITFWIEFFKNPYSEICRELYKFVPELKEAKELFEKAKADPKKRRLLEEREDAARNYASDISSAHNEGREEERAKAMAEKRESAIKLLKMGLLVDQVGEALGLSIEEVSEIKKKVQ